MTRGQGKHLKKGETKQNIIEFIVSKPSLVMKESEIREYLIEKHNTSETKNIKEQLKGLSKEKLITKEDNFRLGLTNKWSIEDAKQLQRIVKKYNVLTKIMQKNDKIISLILDQHFKAPIFFKELDDMLKTFDECAQCLNSPQRPEGIDCNFNEDERKKCIEKSNNAKTEVNIEIEDGTAGQFFAMNENGELDISENKLFEDEIKIGEENNTLVNLL